MRSTPRLRHARPRTVPRRPLRLAFWSLVVTLLILAWMLLPYVDRW